MNNIRLTLNNEEIELIKNKLFEYQIEPKNSNVLLFFRYNGATITIFKTKVMLIQGKNSEEIYKEIFGCEYKSSDLDKIDIFENKLVNENKIATMGSDEVGVGDFFGGLIVVAAYVKPDQIEWLKSIGINDSKKLSDERIFELFNMIKDKIAFEPIILTPKEYNEKFEMYENSHIIKAVCHNQALWNLSKKVNRPYFVIIDQFIDRRNYSNYLRKANKTEFTIDIFETKAESKYLAVACASIIARSIFLIQMTNLSNELGIELPLGASNPKIKDISYEIIKRYGINTLKQICKQHFITFRDIVEEEGE